MPPKVVLRSSKCFVCGNLASSSQRLFKVPRSKERLKEWLRIFNREDLLELSDNYLQHNAKVCTDHFSEWAYTGTDRKRLIAFALPETAEPPVVSLPPIVLQSAAVPPSVSSRLLVAASSDDTSLLQVTEPSNELQAAATLSSISSGTQVVGTKLVAPSVSSQSQVAVPSVSPRSQVAVPSTRPLFTVLSARPRVAVPSAGSKVAVAAASSINPRVNRNSSVPLSFAPTRSREKQIIANQRSTISRLRKRIEKLKVSFDEQLKKKLTPEMYTFVKSQIRQSGRRSIRGRRWEQEDKDFALSVYKKSPSVYKLLREKLALPSKATLRRCS